MARDAIRGAELAPDAVGARHVIDGSLGISELSAFVQRQLSQRAQGRRDRPAGLAG